MSIAMADGEVDKDEKVALTIVQNKFAALFQSGDSAVDGQFEEQYCEKLKQLGDPVTFRSKFLAAQDIIFQSGAINMCLDTICQQILI